MNRRGYKLGIRKIKYYKIEHIKWGGLCKKKKKQHSRERRNMKKEKRRSNEIMNPLKCQ